MQTRPLGPSGIEASAVAFGAWAIGGWMWGGTDDDDAVRAIHAALDAGITLIDTAPVYGFGHSEEVVGRAIADRRDKVVLATKCGLLWDRDEGEVFFISDEFSRNPEGQFKIRRFLGPHSVRREVEDSLKRLGTDCIDLLQTHWQDSTTPIADTMAEFLKLKDEGKIRAIGACNASPDDMEQYRAAGPFANDQEKYSMLDRDREQDNLPYCREHGVAVLAYSPLAMGLLTGKISADRKFGKGDIRSQLPRFGPENIKKVNSLLEAIRPIADARKLTLAQLVIAWTIAQPGLTHALVGARNPQQAQENAAAGGVVLSADELQTIATALAEKGQGIL